MEFDESMECLEELLRDRVKELPWYLSGKEATCQRFFMQILKAGDSHSVPDLGGSYMLWSSWAVRHDS